MQDVQTVHSWRQLAVGNAFRLEQDAARADAGALRDAMDRSSGRSTNPNPNPNHNLNPTLTLTLTLTLP